jgi:hypothetical protein
MQVLGSVINGQLGVAARIAALRHSSPEVAPQVPTLIAAEVPILSVEAALAVLASFVLVRPACRLRPDLSQLAAAARGRRGCLVL